jgi:hypothetical protein
MNSAPVKDSISDRLSARAVAFVSENGYSPSLVEGFVNEAMNIIESLGENKYMEFIKAIHAAAASSQAGIDNAAAGEGAQTRPSLINDELREEILILIREELKRSGAIPPPQAAASATGQEPVPAEAAPRDASVPVPVDLKDASARMKAYSEKVSEKICEDLSTIAGEKIKLDLKPVEIKKYAAVVGASDEKFIFVEGVREDGTRLLARVAAKGAVKLSGLMTMVPANILDEKVKSLNLGSSDIDAIKEIFNQIIGSLNKLNENNKLKLNNIIIMDGQKELEYVTDNEDYLTVTCGWSLGSEDLKDFIICVPVKDSAALDGIKTGL